MIIVLKPNTSKENVARVEELIKRKGLDTHVVKRSGNDRYRLYRRYHQSRSQDF